MATEQKAISVAAEIHDLAHTAEVIQLLIDRATEDLLAGTDLAKPSLRAAGTVAGLLESRCVLLRRAIRGELDPAFVWSASNAAFDGDDLDLLLPVWTDAERIEWHRRNLSREHRHNGRRGRR